MSVQSSQVSVGTTTAVLLAEAPVTRPCTVYLSGEIGSIYVGGSDLDSSNGVEGNALGSSTGAQVELVPGDALYGLAISATQIINVLVLGAA